MPSYFDLSLRLNKLHIAWFNAMEAQQYQQASFLSNDIVNLAQQLRRESFTLLDSSNGNSQTKPE